MQQQQRNPRSARRGARIASSLPAFVIGGFLGIVLFASAPAIARTAAQWVNGGGGAGSVTEPPFLFTENNGPKRAIQVERSLVKLPPDYGEPFAVTSSGVSQIVWYRHPELGVRNVVVQGDRRLVHLLEIESLKTSEVSKGTAK